MEESPIGTARSSTTARSEDVVAKTAISSPLREVAAVGPQLRTLPLVPQSNSPMVGPITPTSSDVGLLSSRATTSRHDSQVEQLGLQLRRLQLDVNKVREMTFTLDQQTVQVEKQISKMDRRCTELNRNTTTNAAKLGSLEDSVKRQGQRLLALEEARIHKTSQQDARSASVPGKASEISRSEVFSKFSFVEDSLKKQGQRLQDLEESLLKKVPEPAALNLDIKSDFTTKLSSMENSQRKQDQRLLALERETREAPRYVQQQFKDLLVELSTQVESLTASATEESGLRKGLRIEMEERMAMLTRDKSAAQQSSDVLQKEIKVALNEVMKVQDRVQALEDSKTAQSSTALAPRAVEARLIALETGQQRRGAQLETPSIEDLQKIQSRLQELEIVQRKNSPSEQRDFVELKERLVALEARQPSTGTHLSLSAQRDFVELKERLVALEARLPSTGTHSSLPAQRDLVELKERLVALEARQPTTGTQLQRSYEDSQNIESRLQELEATKDVAGRIMMATEEHGQWCILVQAQLRELRQDLTTSSGAADLEQIQSRVQQLEAAQDLSGAIMKATEDHGDWCRLVQAQLTEVRLALSQTSGSADIHEIRSRLEQLESAQDVTNAIAASTEYHGQWCSLVQRDMRDLRQELSQMSLADNPQSIQDAPLPPQASDSRQSGMSAFSDVSPVNPQAKDPARGASADRGLIVQGVRDVLHREEIAQANFEGELQKRKDEYAEARERMNLLEKDVDGELQTLQTRLAKLAQPEVQVNGWLQPQRNTVGLEGLQGRLGGRGEEVGDTLSTFESACKWVKENRPVVEASRHLPEKHGSPPQVTAAVRQAAKQEEVHHHPSGFLHEGGL